MRKSILKWDIERTKVKRDGYGEIRDRAEDDEGEEEDDEEAPQKRRGEWMDFEGS